MSNLYDYDDDLIVGFHSFILSFLIIIEDYLGDYSIRVPPLPIPNREVKPNHADGTAS